MRCTEDGGGCIREKAGFRECCRGGIAQSPTLPHPSHTGTHPTGPKGVAPLLEERRSCPRIQVWGAGEDAQFQARGPDRRESRTNQRDRTKQGSTGVCPGEGGKARKHPIYCVWDSSWDKAHGSLSSGHSKAWYWGEGQCTVCRGACTHPAASTSAHMHMCCQGSCSAWLKLQFFGKRMLLIVRNRSFRTPGSLSETGESGWGGRPLAPGWPKSMWDRKTTLGLGLRACARREPSGCHAAVKTQCPQTPTGHLPLGKEAGPPRGRVP